MGARYRRRGPSGRAEHQLGFLKLPRTAGLRDGVGKARRSGIYSGFPVTRHPQDMETARSDAAVPYERCVALLHRLSPARPVSCSTAPYVRHPAAIPAGRRRVASWCSSESRLVGDRGLDEAPARPSAKAGVSSAADRSCSSRERGEAMSFALRPDIDSAFGAY